MNEDWKGLNLPQLIDLLEPVPEPDTISMMPQTAGWIWLGLAVLAGIGFAAWRFYRWRQQTAYRREALAELAACGDNPRQLADLLRRTALTAYPRAEVASLYGREWLAFLDRTYDGNAFLDGPGQCLADAPYRRKTETSDLTPVVREWIRTHRREAA